MTAHLTLAPSPDTVLDLPRIDPLRAAAAFRTVELFRKWTDARPGRMMRATTVKLAGEAVGMALVEIYQDGLLVASGIDADFFYAMGVAVQIATAA